MQVSSAKEYFDTLDERFVAAKAAGISAVYQFELTGDGGGTGHVVVADGGMNVHEGKHDEPSATLTAAADIYVKIANGTMNGLRAVMSRKMKIDGNLVMARKMSAIFPPSS